jgi:hypothetical protein
MNEPDVSVLRCPDTRFDDGVFRGSLGNATSRADRLCAGQRKRCCDLLLVVLLSALSVLPVDNADSRKRALSALPRPLGMGNLTTVLVGTGDGCDAKAFRNRSRTVGVSRCRVRSRDGPDDTGTTRSQEPTGLRPDQSDERGDMTDIRTTEPAGPIPEGYTERDRVLDSESRLSELDGLFWRFVLPAVVAGVSDSADAWRLLKLATYELVGHGRGALVLADAVPTTWCYTGHAALGRGTVRIEPTNDTERFLRTSGAWDAVTDPWVDALHHADAGRSTASPERRRRSPRWATAS